MKPPVRVGVNISHDRSVTSSPRGPLSRNRSASISSDSAESDVSDPEESRSLRRCVFRLRTSENETKEIVKYLPRLDVVLKRKNGQETFVVARASTREEKHFCAAAQKYQMYLLHSRNASVDTGDFDAQGGSSSKLNNDVESVADDDVDGEAVYHFVARDEPILTKFFGVMRWSPVETSALARRFGVDSRDSAGDFIVDRFFATGAANQIAAEPNGPEFVRRLMVDSLREVCLKGETKRHSGDIPILSAVPVHGRRGDCRRCEFDDACEEMSIDSRERRVSEKYFRLSWLPLRDPAAPSAKSWRRFKSVDGHASMHSTNDGVGSNEDDDDELVVDFTPFARQTSVDASDQSQRLKAAFGIARACGVTLGEDDIDVAVSLLDAVTCALRNDSGYPSDRLFYDRSQDWCTDDFIDGMNFVRGTATARHLATTLASSNLEDILSRVHRSMDVQSVNVCVVIARFDTMSELSNLIAMAGSQGLFPDGGLFKTLAQNQTLFAARFVRREFRVRPSKQADIQALVDMETDSWRETPEMRTPATVVRERVENNAAMNFVVEDIATNAVRGVMYTQYIEDVEAPLNTIWEFKESIRKPVGATNVVQLLDVFADQEYSAKSTSASISVGQELRNFVLTYAEHSNVSYACAVTRTRGYRKTQSEQPSLSYDDYVYGPTLDRGVYFHTSAGAEIMQIVRPWRARDHENAGNGVLIRYDVREYAFARAARKGRHRRMESRRPSDPTRLRENGEYVSPLEACAWEARAQAFPVD